MVGFRLILEFDTPCSRPDGVFEKSSLVEDVCAQFRCQPWDLEFHGLTIGSRDGDHWPPCSMLPNPSNLVSSPSSSFDKLTCTSKTKTPDDMARKGYRQSLCLSTSQARCTHRNYNHNMSMMTHATPMHSFLCQSFD